MDNDDLSGRRTESGQKAHCFLVGLADCVDEMDPFFFFSFFFFLFPFLFQTGHSRPLDFDRCEGEPTFLKYCPANT